MATSNQKTHRDLYAEVTQRVIIAMENGNAPWQRPWQQVCVGGPPQNGVSQRPYQGINTLLMFLQAWERGYTDQRWMTFRQAVSLGVKVRKGEKSSQAVFYKTLVVEDTDRKTGDTVKKQIPYLTQYQVFNAEQIEGLPQEIPPLPSWPPLEAAERLINHLAPQVRHGGSRAFYSPTDDVIRMPAIAAFPNAADYYGTLLHEVGHWTGHVSRLNRQFGVFGSEAYAREELRAEWASVMLSATLGIPHDADNHAAYLTSWVKKLKEDKYEIFRAARDAQGIANFVLGYGEHFDDDTEVVEKTEISLGYGVILNNSAVIHDIRSQRLTPQGNQTVQGCSRQEESIRYLCP